MADATFLLKLVGQLDALPDGQAILPSWEFVVFDPEILATYKTTGKQLVDALVPTTTFGVGLPAYPSAYPVNSVYFQTPTNGGLSIWQLEPTEWVLRWTFGGGTGTPTAYVATKGYTASCGAGTTGESVYREVTRRSTVSQLDADTLALTAATAQANAALVCSVVGASYTSTQSFTASCPVGSVGNAVTQSSTYVSTISQADADRRALAAARASASQALVCTVSTVVPPAPTFTSYNIAARTATVAPPSGFTLADLDYVINGGQPLAVSATGIIRVGNAEVLAGNLVSYVRAGTGHTRGSLAISSVDFPVYQNTFSSTRSYTARCPAGQTGPAISRTSTQTSTLSQVDADNKALADATAQANAALVCTVIPVTYSSTKSYTATCQTGYTGNAVTRTSTKTSTVSQTDADNLALADATSAANSALVCTPVAATTYSSTKAYTATCPSGSTGNPVTRTATRTSTNSQAEADSLALSDATAAAQAALVCTVSPTSFTSTRSYTASCGSGTTGSPVTRSSTKTSTVSQADADNLALSDATAQANAALVCTPTSTTPTTVTAYVGALTNNPPSSAQVLSLATQTWDKGARIFSVICTDTYPAFAEPKTQGIRATISDGNGFNITSSVSRSTLTLNGTDYWLYEHNLSQYDDNFIFNLSAAS